MSSNFSQYFNAKARPFLADVHSELITLRIKDTEDAQLKGTWRRVLPNIATDEDGLGAQGYTGEATFVVQIEDMATLPPARALLIRNGEEWTIRHPERQDQWTWILHLARPDADLRMPRKLK